MGAAAVAWLEAEPALDAGAALGEGPRWDAAAGRLEWVDMTAGSWSRWAPGAPAADVAARRLGARVSMVAARAGGGHVAAVDGGLTLLDGAGAIWRRIAVLPREEDDLVLNDGACDPAGRLWVGSASRAGAPRGALHRVDPGADRAVTALAGVTMANGIGWSADGRRLWFVDSSAQGLDAIDCDPESGRLGARRRVVDVPRAEGIPDGLCVDAEGCVWLAVWGAGEVRRLDPGGRLLARVRVPASQVTSCAFGGPDLATLWITTAREGLAGAALAREPHAGGIFAVEPGVRGLPARPFGG